MGWRMSGPDYVVLRAAPGLPERFFPTYLDGRWIDRSHFGEGPIPAGEDLIPGWTFRDDGTQSQVTFVPTGRFEVRLSDGAVAEVFEVRSDVPGEKS